MNLGIWLIPVLAGYSVLRFSHFWKRSFTSTSGYEFFFGAALAGSLLLIVARLITWVGEAMGADATALWFCWKEYADFNHSGTLAVVILLALMVIALMNWVITDQDYVIRMPGQWDPRPDDVALAPVASGYRRRDTHRLELTRFYAEFPEPHEYLIVLPITKVASICRFDPDVYNAANSA